ncbi:MAG TPA: DUF1570 domain-containing protein [Vicinamibacterales bacterium]|nr:DUF1570 domain-containing protein [Vicinamibacterales bacterium]
MRRLIAAGCLAAGMIIGWSSPAGADVAPQRDWRQIQSAHFRVMGAVSPRALRQVAGRMEQLHELLTTLAPASAGEQTPDTTVLVFANRKAYRPFQPLYNGAPQDVGGYFQPGPMNYITLLMSQESDEQSVVYHEYVHLVLNRRQGQVAPWIGEGLAEFYSTFEIGDGGRKARLGKMLQRHLWALQQNMMPLDTLVRVTRDSPYYNEQDKNTVFYAQSWALIHFLQLGQQRKYAPQFGAFLEAVNAGTPFATACQTVLGVAPAVLEQELRAYAFAPVLYRVDVELPTRLSSIEKLAPAPVPEAEVHAVLGDLVSHLDDRPEGRAHLEQALKLDAHQALALAALAQLDADAGRLPEAEAWAAADAATPTFLSEFYRARALQAVATDTHTLAPEIEAALRQTIALNPTFAPAHERLAEHLADAEATRAEALRLITRAVSLAPVRDDFLLVLARIHLLNHDLMAARGVLGPLAARGSSAELKAAARRFLAYSARLETALAGTAELGLERPPAAPALQDAPAPGPTPADPALPASELVDHPPPVLTPVLRQVGAGETRVLGTWSAIECRPTGVVIVAAAAGGELRVRAEALDEITFTSYRTDTPSAIGCGPQTPLPVLITYRPAPTSQSAGEAVAIEFLPDGYKPGGGRH